MPLHYPFDLGAYFQLVTSKGKWNKLSAAGISQPPPGPLSEAYQYQTFLRLNLQSGWFAYYRGGRQHAGTDLPTYAVASESVGVIGPRAIARGKVYWRYTQHNKKKSDLGGEPVWGNPDGDPKPELGGGMVILECEFPAGHEMAGQKFYAKYVHFRNQDVAPGKKVWELGAVFEPGEEMGKLGKLIEDTHLHFMIYAPRIEALGPALTYEATGHEEGGKWWRNGDVDARSIAETMARLDDVAEKRIIKNGGFPKAADLGREYSLYHTARFIHWVNEGTAGDRASTPVYGGSESEETRSTAHAQGTDTALPNPLRSKRLGGCVDLVKVVMDPEWRASGVIKRGEKSERVRALQEGLAFLGFYVGKKGPDADFGENTEKAIKSFQESWMPPWEGIRKDHPMLSAPPWRKDGKADLNTVYVFDRVVFLREQEEAPPPPPEPTDATASAILKSRRLGASAGLKQHAADPAWRQSGSIAKGTWNDERVRAIQDALTYLTFDVGGVDGKFGGGTETAVKKFQTDWMDDWLPIRADHPLLGPPPWLTSGAVDFNMVYILDRIVFLREQAEAQSSGGGGGGSSGGSSGAVSSEDPAPSRSNKDGALKFHVETTTDPRHVIFQGVADTEGGYDTINMWDSAIVSVGIGQWTLIHGKMQTLYDFLRANHADDYRRIVVQGIGIDLPSSRSKRSDLRLVVGGATLDGSEDDNFRAFEDAFRPGTGTMKERSKSDTAKEWKRKFAASGRDAVCVQCQYEYKTFELFGDFFPTRLKNIPTSLNGKMDDAAYKPPDADYGPYWKLLDGDLWLQAWVFNLYVNAPGMLKVVLAAAANRVAQDKGYQRNCETWPGRAQWRDDLVRKLERAVEVCRYREDGTFRPWRDSRTVKTRRAYERLTGDASATHGSPPFPGIQFDAGGRATGPANALAGYERARAKAAKLSYLG